jgi:hypothetical protein
MKNLFLLLLTLSICLGIQAQDKKLKIHSVNLGLGGFSIKNKYSEGGGVMLLGDLTTSYHKNLIGLSLFTGAEIGIIGKSNYTFNQVSLLYGRELKINKWFSFEAFAGIGNYNQVSESSEIMNGNAIAYPFKINTKFILHEGIGLGLNANYIINKINNNFSANILIFYNLN